MGIIVQKFGGSSVADNERLLNVCKHIINEYNKNINCRGRTPGRLAK